MKNSSINKNIILIISYCILIMLAACDNTKATNASEPPVKEASASDENLSDNGTYVAEGRTYTGKVKTETSGLKLFTVRCEGDVVQQIEFRFKNGEAARKGGSYKSGSLTPIESNGVGLMFGIGFNSEEGSGGIITVSSNGGKNVIEFKDVKLTTTDKSMVVSGKISF